MLSDIADNLSIVVHCNLISMTLHGFRPVVWTVAGALRSPADCGMQADIGRPAVQAVVFGDRDLKRRLLAEPQRAAEAEHDGQDRRAAPHPMRHRARNGHRAAPSGSDG